MPQGQPYGCVLADRRNRGCHQLNAGGFTFVAGKSSAQVPNIQRLDDQSACILPLPCRPTYREGSSLSPQRDPPELPSRRTARVQTPGRSLVHHTLHTATPHTRYYPATGVLASASAARKRTVAELPTSASPPPPFSSSHRSPRVASATLPRAARSHSTPHAAHPLRRHPEGA